MAWWHFIGSNNFLLGFEHHAQSLTNDESLSSALLGTHSCEIWLKYEEFLQPKMNIIWHLQNNYHFVQALWWHSVPGIYGPAGTTDIWYLQLSVILSSVINSMVGSCVMLYTFNSWLNQYLPFSVWIYIYIYLYIYIHIQWWDAHQFRLRKSQDTVNGIWWYKSLTTLRDICEKIWLETFGCYIPKTE